MGDTIIAQLLGKEDQRDELGRVRNEYPCDLKKFDFYQMPWDLQVKVYTETIKPWLDTNQIIGAHRFEQFDFKKLNSNFRVLSIDPRSQLEQVAGMFLSKVQADQGYYLSIDQAVNNAIVARYGSNSKIQLQLAQKRIVQWTEHNILSTDIVLSLDEFLQDSSCIDEFRIT
jgi:hypothetical protein